MTADGGTEADAAGALAGRLDRMVPTRAHRVAVLVVGLGLFFDLFEIFMSGVLGSVLKERLHLGHTATSAVLASVFVGMFAGVLLGGVLAERVGRRRALLTGIAVYTVFSAIGACSVDMPMLIAARCLAGIGIGPVLPLTDAYLADLLPPAFRGRYTAWAYTIGFLGVPGVGLLGRWLVPLAPLGISGWRWLLIVGALGGACMLALRRRLVESPRWLITAGRRAEAEAIIEDWERGLPAAAAADDAVRAPAPVAAPGRDLPPRVLRSRVTMLVIFHLLQSYGSYGFGTMAPLVLSDKGYSIVNSLLFSALTFLGYPLGSLISIPLIERLERKYLIVGAALAMAASGVVFGEANGSGLIIAAGMCYTALSNVFSNGYHVYQAEIFPTAQRVKFVARTYSLSRLTTAGMPFVMVPFLHSFGAGALFTAVAATLTLLALNVWLLGPRSTGQGLEAINEALSAGSSEQRPSRVPSG
jgi:putative MFS transporter